MALRKAGPSCFRHMNLTSGGLIIPKPALIPFAHWPLALSKNLYNIFGRHSS
jgi:hypothetical protein